MSDDQLAREQAARNRRKLEEHLARLKAQGGLQPKEEARGAEPERAEAKQPPREPPKQPPKPPGWEAWKKAHAGRFRTVQPVNEAQAAEEADYRILEIERGASKDEIRRAFHQLAKTYHPDHGGDEGIFLAMLAAYDRLMKAV